MDGLLANLALGWETAISPVTLAFCFFGVLLGTVVGVLPGIGALAAISILLPLTYHIDTIPAIVMLAGIYYGSVYGGSTAAILLRIPGTISTAITCLDGYPMAQNGRAGVALFITAIASFVGGMIGLILLIFFAPALAEFGLRFGPPEYFSVMFLGLVAASVIGTGAPLKGLSMVFLGLLLGTVGIDVNTGVTRFTFGSVNLQDGLSLIALAMGIFGVSEIVTKVNSSFTISKAYGKIRLRTLLPTRDDWKRSAFPMIRGSAIGGFFGPLPGAGPSISSFVSYAVEQRIAKDPSRFGKGAIEGVAGPESANNSGVQTAFVPTLTLGVPGDAVMAILLGAFILHGVAPGPMLVQNHPDLFWGLIVSFALGNVMLLALNIPLVGLWVKLLSIPYYFLYPTIIVFISIGVFSIGYNTFDIGVLIVFGLLGYVMLVLGFSPVPLLLGFVLGPLVEEYLARSLLLSRGDLMTFVERPISAALLALTALLLAWVVYTSLAKRKGRSSGFDSSRPD